MSSLEFDEIPLAKDYKNKLIEKAEEKRKAAEEKEYSNLLNSFIQALKEGMELPYSLESRYPDFISYPKLSFLTEKGYTITKTISHARFNSWNNYTLDIAKEKSSCSNKTNEIKEPVYDMDTTFEGTTTWYKKGEIHRDYDLPAVIYADNSKYWYQNGKRHRDNGQPAVILSNGLAEWWENGVFIKRGYLTQIN